MRDTIFGLKILLSVWENEEKLPLFVSSAYDFSRALLDGVSCLLLTAKEPFPSIREMLGHIREIEKIEEDPVVFYFETVNGYKRNALIDNRIAFFTEKQAYLPFLGAVLVNETKKQKSLGDHLTFSAQLLVLYYITKKKECLYMKEAASALHYSPMTISRALDEIRALRLFDVYKDGVNNVIESKLGCMELFLALRNYLKSPVLKVCYLNKKDITEDMTVAGENALGEKTMLVAPENKTYAVDKRKIDKSLLMDEFFDEENQVRVEIWTYDPLLLSRDKYPDNLSLILSLEDSRDERVEEAIEELINMELGE